MNERIEYLADAAVSDADDAQLRQLFCTCFSTPEGGIFSRQRFYNDPYPHRWVIRDDAGRIVAHVGVHERQVIADGQRYDVAGIAEVTVLPAFRGRGYVKRILGDVHAWLATQRFAFSLLFGDPRVYRSSGYVQIHNVLRDPDPGEAPNEGNRRRVSAMVRPMKDIPWPTCDVHLIGLRF